MLTYLALSFLLMLSVAKSDVDFDSVCKNDYRNMNNTQIDVTKLCASNTCIVKCCGDGEMFNPRGHCTNTKKMFQRFKKKISKLVSDVDYLKIVLYSWDGSVQKKSKNNFVFVKNQRSLINCTIDHYIENIFFILEDGSVRMQDTFGTKTWLVIKKLEYCIDFKLTVINRQPQVKLLVRENMANDLYDWLMVQNFIPDIGMLISAFFLVVVLVVYCLLPELQNLMGLILMAYCSSFLVRSIVNTVLMLSSESLTPDMCKIMSPMTYFTAVSSVLWMNVMSIEVWWFLRGHRKTCDINRRDERVKFMWYCLYAWGIPLLITAIVTTLDNIDLSNLHISKPHFDDCLLSNNFFLYSYVIPIGVIISVNIILFSLTVFNIWMTERAVNKCQGSKSSTKDTNRITTYVKLSVVMGVSLFLDLIEMNIWLYILTATFNRLIGVFLFFLFVFNKRIFLKLCKRFNIKNNFTKRIEASQNQCFQNHKGNKNDNVQMHEMNRFDLPKGENVID